MSESIKEILMRRDGESEETANELITAAKKDLWDRLENPTEFDDPHSICMDHFGLEPDYIFDLMPY